ncbi:MAG TPA: TylF/MycF/NovP-related O-methyltransferase [Flavobacteriales bacterium]|nr:TylF/MycF/NovP-related O-methyltransferase [Flavobacteriales bacterium]HRO40656.1 TylF/MycF/NovP-related O-methyltransferase [Flavobacteriales bacterium]HRP82700.1 TylF/MycF/NovP-related O-methyltransferase [Flavobacteriales bacterium]
MGNSIAAKVLRNSGQWLLKQSGTEVRDPALMDDPVFTDLYARCSPYTMTSRERLHALYNACMYVVDAKLEGAFVECGVWKGGSAMMMALCLKQRGITDRDIYLFDTFEGMSRPEEVDRTFKGEGASGTFEETATADDASDWCRSPVEEVMQHMRSTGYPAERVHLVKGKVENTLPSSVPASGIALLRLDTDWYASTRHELVHLYPKLVQRGVLIIDDFGHWEGARKAVLEYFDEQKIHMLLNRIDYTGRIGIKA